MGCDMKFSREEVVDDVQADITLMCPECQQTWEQSGIVNSLSRVDWNTLELEVCFV